jgi:hypothetical protein
MELELIRTKPTDKSLIGKLAINGVFECFTLERSHQDPNIRPIPEGKYPVSINFSPHFGQDMPHITNVPGRTFIEIHWGNVAEDTEGCVLVGMRTSVDEILNSRVAFSALFAKLQSCKDPIFITIKENQNEEIANSTPPVVA